MTPPVRSRRSILEGGGALVGVLAAGGLAGCVDGGDPGSSRSPDGSGDTTGTASPPGTANTAGTDPLAHVPPTADAVATADVNALLGDDGVRAAADAWFAARAEASNGDGPTTLATTLDALEDREGFDVRDLSGITAFASFAADGAPASDLETGFVLEGSWDDSAVLSTVDTRSVEYAESAYAGHTTYEPSSSFGSTLVGVLGDGRYVVGGREAVRGAIDVERGETAPVDGPIAGAYGDARAGPVHFASTVPSSWIPDQVQGRDGPIDLSPAKAIRTVAGAVYREGDARAIEVRLNAPDAAAAKELDDVVRSLLALAAAQPAESTARSPVAALFEDVEVGREGASVVLTVERTVAELKDIATTLGEQTAQSAPRTPTARFDFAYAADANAVTITHEAGDAIAADRLYVQGEGVADAEGADMTASGQWAGTTRDDGTVAAGDSVVVGVGPDFVLRIVWRGEDVAATVDQYDGPAA